MNKKAITIAGTLTLAGLAVAACGSGAPPTPLAHGTSVPTAPAVTYTPPTQDITLYTDNNGISCAAAAVEANGYCPGSIPSPTDTPSDTSGPLNTTFTVTTQDTNGNTVVYDVTAISVRQSVAPGAYETLNNPADHLSAVRFTIKGVTGQANDDANSDANVISNDTTQYSSTYTSDLPNFSSGEFTVAPGQTVSGWVAFELPPGQSVTSVQWAPGFGSAATWTVGK